MALTAAVPTDAALASDATNAVNTMPRDNIFCASKIFLEFYWNFLEFSRILIENYNLFVATAVVLNRAVESYETKWVQQSTEGSFFSVSLSR